MIVKKSQIVLAVIILISTQAIASPIAFKEKTNHIYLDSNEEINEVISETENILIPKNNTDFKITQSQENKIYYKNHSFTISPEDIHITYSNEKKSISLLNSTLLNKPGLPVLPMKTFTLTLPYNACINTIKLSEYDIKKTSQLFSYQIAPKPKFWSLNETPLHNHSDEIIEKSITAAMQQDLYPGEPFSYVIGKNKTSTKTIIQIFPLQYQFSTNTSYLITHGKISISYSLNNLDQNKNLDNTENIIITHPSFTLQANRLQKFHNNKGIQTEVVSTTWIKSNFEPSPYPPIMGYKDFTFRERIKKYDDTLALKIITFLQSQSTNKNLKFVTILGNAIHVPPSYYFGYSYYPVPTDFYYASPDLDLIPNYRIGRLPVHTFLEAKRTVDKIINWDPTYNQMNNVAIAGGIPFNSPFFIGELITIDSVNRGFFDGLNVDKYYRTDENFEGKDIKNALQDDYGLLYMICHGNANVIVAEEGRLSARSINLMKRNNNAPIFSCIACSSGSYDTHLIKQGYSMDKTSFGESMVVSKGGGICYIGGARTNNGYPLLTVQNGRVVISKETYLAGLLTYVNQAYKKNKEHLGDLTFFAYETFLDNNDLSDYWNQYHYFGFVLLGDPALQLPQRSFDQTSYQLPETTDINAADMIDINAISTDYPGTVGLHAIGETNHFKCHTDSPLINLKQIETGNYQSVEVDVSSHDLMNDNVSISIDTNQGRLQLLRFETIDGKEDWMYYQPARPVNPNYNSDSPGFGVTRWNTIQNALNNAQQFDTIFVVKGEYKESIFIDYPCYLLGEDKEKTIIDGNGYDDVISIFSDGVSIEGFTIQHCGQHPWNAGIRIDPDRSLKKLPITIKNNIITNNKNCGIFVDIDNKLLFPKISVSNNDISHNNYGFLIHQGYTEKEIIQNNIFANNYGLYLKESEKNTIVYNNIQNNYIGLHLTNAKKTKVNLCNFIENNRDCQFSEITFTSFDQNYWDSGIDRLFGGILPIPKLVYGYHDEDLPLISQIRLDLHPLKVPVNI